MKKSLGLSSKKVLFNLAFVVVGLAGSVFDGFGSGFGSESWKRGFHQSAQPGIAPANTVNGAIAKNDLARLKALVASGASVTDVDINYPVSFGYLPIVKYLIEEKGLDIKKANVNEAIKNNKLEMLKYLVEKDANIIKNVDANAVRKVNNLEMYLYLKSKGAVLP
jgi:hypothetical protein